MIKRRCAHSNSGFTLIETLIYLALFTIIIGVVLAAVFNIIQATTRNQDKSLIAEETHFLEAKINWALTGVKTIHIPTSGSSDVLQVDKFDNPPTSATTVSLTKIGDNIEIDGGSGPALLNSGSVKVENITFTYLDPIGTSPAGIQAVFKLKSKYTGYSQSATTTKYLR